MWELPLAYSRSGEGVRASVYRSNSADLAEKEHIIAKQRDLVRKIVRKIVYA